MSYLNQNNLLFHNQHWFRSRVSCETQLIQFSLDLYDTLKQGGQTDVIVMDFRKAFDKVDHQRLLLKLHRLGINTIVIVWIKSFSSGRSHRVWSSTVNSLVPAQYCLGCHRDPYLGPACFSCTLTTCQTQSKATSGCLPMTPSCSLPLQISQTVKPYNPTLPFSNPGRVNGLWPSILRSVKSLGLQKKPHSLTISFMVSHFNFQKLQNILASKSQMI